MPVQVLGSVLYGNTVRDMWIVVAIQSVQAGPLLVGSGPLWGQFSTQAGQFRTLVVATLITAALASNAALVTAAAACIGFVRASGSGD